MKRLLNPMFAMCLMAMLSASANFCPTVEAESVVRSSVMPSTIGTYYCEKCGKYHSSPKSASVLPNQPITYSSRSPAAVPSTGWLRGGGGVQNVLSTLNAQRARNGLGSLRFDPALRWSIASIAGERNPGSRVRDHGKSVLGFGLSNSETR